MGKAGPYGSRGDRRRSSVERLVQRDHPQPVVQQGSQV
jgi:hypothetical protein